MQPVKKYLFIYNGNFKLNKSFKNYKDNPFFGKSF